MALLRVGAVSVPKVHSNVLGYVWTPSWIGGTRFSGPIDKATGRVATLSKWAYGSC